MEAEAQIRLQEEQVRVGSILEVNFGMLHFKSVIHSFSWFLTTNNQAQQSLYRSKMESWAVSRRQQLEQQMSRLQELTTGLRTRKLLLDKELADLVGVALSLLY